MREMSAKIMSLKCVECARIFDLTNESDSQEWYFGHDCEGVI